MGRLNLTIIKILDLKKLIVTEKHTTKQIKVTWIDVCLYIKEAPQNHFKNA